MKVRLSFDGTCPTHRRYNPAVDGRPHQGLKNDVCPTCDRLYVIWRYSSIAQAAIDALGGGKKRKMHSTESAE